LFPDKKVFNSIWALPLSEMGTVKIFICISLGTMVIQKKIRPLCGYSYSLAIAAFVPHLL